MLAGLLPVSRHARAEEPLRVDSETRIALTGGGTAAYPLMIVGSDSLQSFCSGEEAAVTLTKPGFERCMSGQPMLTVEDGGAVGKGAGASDADERGTGALQLTAETGMIPFFWGCALSCG